jgi:hypothetical protein
MTKREIMREAECGGRVRPRDVARVSRSRKYVTLRHVWPEDVDARVWARIERESLRLCQDIANYTGHAVELYAAEGHVLAQVQPQPLGIDRES